LYLSSKTLPDAENVSHPIGIRSEGGSMAICGRCGRGRLESPVRHVLECRASYKSIYKAHRTKRPCDSGSKTQVFEAKNGDRYQTTSPSRNAILERVWGDCVKKTDRIAKRLDRVKKKREVWLKKLALAQAKEDRARREYVKAGGQLPA